MNYKEMYLNGLIPENLRVYDCHVHTGYFPGTTAFNSSAEALCSIMDRMKIKKSVVSATEAIKGNFKDGNDYVVNVVAKYPDKLLGYAVVNPNYPDGTVDEIKRCRGKNMVGIKIHPSYARMGVLRPEYESVFRYANERGTVILVHTWSSNDVKELTEIAEKYPGGKYIIAHSGALDGYMFTANVIKTHTNLWCDICMGSAPSVRLEYLVEHGSDDKILFGSDALLSDPGITYGRIMLSDIPDRSKEKIMGENFEKLFADAEL